MEPLSILMSILGSSAMYGLFKLLKKCYRHHTFRSSCMVEHEAENPTRETEDDDSEEEQ